MGQLYQSINPHNHPKEISSRKETGTFSVVFIVICNTESHNISSFSKHTQYHWISSPWSQWAQILLLVSKALYCHISARTWVIGKQQLGNFLFSVQTTPHGLIFPWWKFWWFHNDEDAQNIRNIQGVTPLYHWTFRLHENFAAKMVFNFVYFSGLQTDISCDTGRLDLVDCDLNKHFLEAQFSRNCFCGIHPRTTIFTKCSSFSVRTRIKLYVFHDTILNYSVVDFGYMHNIPLGNVPYIKITRRVVTKLVWALYFPQKSIMLLVYLVQTIKYMTLKIEAILSDKTSIEVYDGPGIKSKKFIFEPLENKTRSVSIAMSTFQCVVYAYSYNMSLRYSTQYNSQTIQNSSNINPNKSETISFDGHMISQEDTICVLHIQTNTGHNIKLSNFYLNYTGEYNTDTCSYAGLAAYEQEEETDTICLKPGSNKGISEEKNLYVFPNIYSHGRRLTVVFYQFEKYGNLTVKFKLTTTSCRPLLINVCHVTNQQPFVDIFLTHIGEYSFVVSKKECLILQLGYYKKQQTFVPLSLITSESVTDSERCEADFKPVTKTQGRSKIELNISGFFRGKLFAPVQITE